MQRSPIRVSSYIRMKKLLFILLLVGCQQRPCKPDMTWYDTLWFDESPIDTEIIQHIYNAERMEDIFPSDTIE